MTRVTVTTLGAIVTRTATDAAGKIRKNAKVGQVAEVGAEAGVATMGEARLALTARAGDEAVGHNAR